MRLQGSSGPTSSRAAIIDACTSGVRSQMLVDSDGERVMCGWTTAGGGVLVGGGVSVGVGSGEGVGSSGGWIWSEGRVVDCSSGWGTVGVGC